LAGFVEELANAGASFAAIPAITPHLAIDELMQRSPIRFANVLTLTASEIQLRGIKRIALFGTKFTIETAFFGALQDVDVVRPRADEVTEIHATYVDVVQTGAGTQAHALKLREIAQTLMHRDGVEAVVLAGTELSLVFNASNTDFPVVDCCGILVDFLVKAARPPKFASLKSL
jgi:aspartate racemase